MSVALWLALLVAANAALFCLPLLPALLEWRRRDRAPLFIPADDEAGISYFAERFRQRLGADWGSATLFASAPLYGSADQTSLAPQLEQAFARLPAVIRAQYRIAQPGADVGGARRLSIQEQPTLLGDIVRLAPGTHQIGEIYASRQLLTAGGSVIRAALCDGIITLGPGSGTLRWAHARRIMVGAGSRVMGRISATDTITVGDDCRFERLSAPCLLFGVGAADEVASPPVAKLALRPQDLAGAPRIEHQTTSRRWLCSGDVDIPDGSLIEDNLVVHGRLRIGANCDVRASLKAHGSVSVGADSRIGGAVFARGSIVISERCQLAGPLSSSQLIRLGPGCRIGNTRQLASIIAPTIHVIGHCTCYGSIWAQRNGLTSAR